MTEILLLIFSLLIILLSAEFFTNGVECLGRRLSLSQAVVGSILAAVGTALPETILPLVAILMHGGDAGKSIGVGAILGAPFMLSTLAFFLVGLTVLISFMRKKRVLEITVEPEALRRDLAFFIVMYASAIFLPLFVRSGRVFIALALVAGYMFYAYMTFRSESGDIMHAEELYFRRIFNRLRSGRAGGTGLTLITVQVVCALALMIGGAHTFVGGLEVLSRAWGMDPMLFALLIAPVATELPEKFNSVSWTLKGRDTLAMGNITGAMVFQSTFPVSVGLLLTDWEMSRLAVLSAILALMSAVVLLTELEVRNRVSPASLLLGGAFYGVYAVVIILTR